MLNIFRKRIANANWVFNGNYIDAKGLFVYKFDTLPCISYIVDINVNEAYRYLRETFETERTEILKHAVYSYDDGKTMFNVTIMILSDKRIIEIGTNYIELLHTSQSYDWANRMLQTLSSFRVTNTEPERTRIGFGQSMN